MKPTTEFFLKVIIAAPFLILIAMSVGSLIVGLLTGLSTEPLNQLVWN